MRSRLVLFLLLLLIWAGALTARLHKVQVLEHDLYVTRANTQHLKQVDLVPPRGTIVDRLSRKLAVSVAVDSVYAPKGVDDPQGVAKSLTKILGGDSKALARKLAAGKWTWIARQIDPDVAEEIRRLEHEGIHFVEESKRYYPLGSLAGPVLGFVGLDHNGLAGLEAAYDEAVSGEPAVRMLLRDALDGRAVAPGLSFLDAAPGEDLHLTIGAGIQHVVERELRLAMERHSARAATAILMDPRDGAILAMASLPSFDPNQFQDYPAETRRNRAVQDAYEPGSTLKLVTAATALEENLLDPLDVLDCEMGSITLGSTRIRDHKPFGLLTFGEVVAKSSNVGAIKAGLLVGPEALFRQLEAFGLGQVTGIDLPGENRGIVRPVRRWSRHEVAYASIGQGLSLTPLQLARLFAVVANGGRLVRPYVVRSIGHQRVQPEMAIDHPALSQATIRTLLRLLEMVVEEGTGSAAAVPGYSVAGKTGTAQKAAGSGYAPGRYVASFAGFVPSREPRVVGVVTLDEPRGLYHGGEVAAPVFSAIMNQVLPLLDVAAEQSLLADATPVVSETARGLQRDDAASRAAAQVPGRAQPRARQGAVPDFEGLSARQALKLASRAGLPVQLQGNGFVRSQRPEAGAPVVAAEEIVLRLSSGRGG